VEIEKQGEMKFSSRDAQKKGEGMELKEMDY
jgi:hypothetical protein